MKRCRSIKRGVRIKMLGVLDAILCLECWSANVLSKKVSVRALYFILVNRSQHCLYAGLIELNQSYRYTVIIVWTANN